MSESAQESDPQRWAGVVPILTVRLAVMPAIELGRVAKALVAVVKTVRGGGSRQYEVRSLICRRGQIVLTKVAKGAGDVCSACLGEEWGWRQGVEIWLQSSEVGFTRAHPRPSQEWRVRPHLFGERVVSRE